MGVILGVDLIVWQRRENKFIAVAAFTKLNSIINRAAVGCHMEKQGMTLMIELMETKQTAIIQNARSCTWRLTKKMLLMENLPSNGVVEKNIGTSIIEGGYLMYLCKKATTHPRL